MGLLTDIAGIKLRVDLTDSQKKSLIYQTKLYSIVDVINNGKPAPNAIEPLLGRSYTLGSISYRINSLATLPNYALKLNVTFTKAPAYPITHNIVIVNPPVKPKVSTGDEKTDLIQSVQEMLIGFVK